MKPLARRDEHQVLLFGLGNGLRAVSGALVGSIAEGGIDAQIQHLLGPAHSAASFA